MIANLALIENTCYMMQSLIALLSSLRFTFFYKLCAKGIYAGLVVCVPHYHCILYHAKYQTLSIRLNE
jgi:hypothetical protein